MVIFQPQGYTYYVYHADRCQRGFLPASTFKIAHTLIALETGVIPHSDYQIDWDGAVRSVEAWNRDHSLRSAFKASAVWYFKEVARRIGRERMQEWLIKLDYGNHEIGASIVDFWLTGDLRITPLQQVEFLHRLHKGELPVTRRSSLIVQQFMALEEADSFALRGKTGWANPQTSEELGWFVGWYETQTEPYYFATIILDPPTGHMLHSRQRVTTRVFESLDFFSWPYKK